MLKVSWVMSYLFCSKFHRLFSSAKICENRLRFDKVTESLKVGTFLRHSVYTCSWKDIQDIIIHREAWWNYLHLSVFGTAGSLGLS